MRRAHPDSLIRGIFDVSWTSAGLGLSKALGVVAAVILARALPAGEFGVFVVASTASVLLVPVLDGGFSILVFRLASHEPPGERFGLVAPAAWARRYLWAGVVVAAAVAGGLVPQAGLIVPLVALSAVAQGYLETAVTDLWGRGTFGLAAVVRAATGALTVAGAVAVSLWGSTAVHALASYAAARLLPAAWVAVRARAPSRLPPELHWRNAVPFGLLGIMMVVYVRSDVLLLSAFGVPAPDVAVYGVVYNVVFALQLLPVAVTATTFRRLARGDDSGARLHTVSMAASLGVLCLALAAVFAAAPQLFGLFGDHYRRHHDDALPLMTVILPVAAGMIAVTGLQARGGERLVLRLTVAALVCNLGLNVALIPVLGIRGAVIATLSTEMLVALGAVRACRVVGLPDLTPMVVVSVLPIAVAPLVGAGVLVVGFAVLGAAACMAVAARPGRGAF